MENVFKGIGYCKPKVILLQDTGIGVAEIAGRTCYDSFNGSENKCIKDFGNSSEISSEALQEINSIEDSDLLDSLAWVHHHHSIIEHARLSFLIKGTSRGVLQEHARHRLQSISVRSTRYTMSDVINAFIASIYAGEYHKAKDFFIGKMLEKDIFVTTDESYNRIELGTIWDKLHFQQKRVGDDGFIGLSVAKSSIPFLSDEGQTSDELFEKLTKGKNKRNVGDPFKHVVSDNWKVDLVVSFNIRSLKNYFDLRDAGSAWFQIQWLAQEMKSVTPVKYLKLIDKKYKNKGE